MARPGAARYVWTRALIRARSKASRAWLLIDFNVPVLLRGVKRIVRNRPSIQTEEAPMAPDPRGIQT